MYSLLPRHRLRGERGTALVEFTLVSVLMLLLVFGIIEFGFDYNNYVSLRNGAREGARLGVVNDINDAPSCTIAGSTVTPPAEPSSPSDASNALVCKTKDRIGLKGSDVTVEIVRGENPGESLEVCAAYPVDSITGLIAPFVDGKTLHTSVTMRLEQAPKFADFTGEGAVC